MTFNIHDRATFDMLFETTITATYCNRNAISTIKEDGHRYKVDQRNVFVFDKVALDDLRYLLEKMYYIPSLDDPELYGTLDFTTIVLTGSGDDNWYIKTI